MIRFVIVLLVLLWAGPSWAATYYIAPTGAGGNDGNPGTEAQPWATITKAFTVIVAGDTVYFREGTYDQSIDSNLHTIPSGTSWENAITIAALPGETVTLNGRINLVTAPCGTGSISYLIFDRLIINAASVDNGIGMCGDNSHHIRHQNGEVMNAPESGIIGIGTGSEIINMKIHDNGTEWTDHGLYWCENDTIVRNNEIYNNSGYGIHLFQEGGGCAHNVEIYNNRIYNNGFSGVTLNHGRNILFYNNLVYGHTVADGWGVQIDRGAVAGQIYHNTLYNNVQGIQVWRVTNTRVQNNILYQSGSVVEEAGSVRLVQSFNLTSDPHFVNAGAADFHLLSSSPARNNGLTIPAVTTDFAGLSRPQGVAYDIGAFEFAEGGGPPRVPRRVVIGQ